MYKTVRHGENSLQYTILPQTEEVLNNSGMKGKGRDYSPSIHVRRSRRRPHFSGRCVTILVLIAILIGAVLALCILTGLPIYGKRYIIPNSIVLPGISKEFVKSPKKELKPAVVTITGPKLETSTTSTTSTTTTTTTTSTAATTERSTTPPWVIPSLIIWKTSTPSTTIPPIPTEDTEKIPLVGTPSGSIRLLDSFNSVKPWEDIIIRPTVTPETVTIKTIFKYYSKSSERPVTTKQQQVFDDVLITAKPTTVRNAVTAEMTTERSKLMDLKETLLSVDDDDEFKESLEVDEVFSLPPLKPDAGSDSDEVTVSKAGDGNWYGARWPFVDTSSYFQWTGYSPGDNLLLPLLVATLSSIALVLLLVFAVRRRKQSFCNSQQIGKLTADLQEDDNTNLLTAESPEDGEGEE